MTTAPALLRRACLLAASALMAAPAVARTGPATRPVDAVAPLPSFAEPAISPDGAEVAFVHAGDIWVVPAGGGTAHLLVSHPAAEGRPVYSPDGKRLAFVSARTGNGDVYVLTFATGDLARLTYDDGLDQLDGWSRDGAWVYFSSSVADLGASNADVYRVRADGGTPMAVSAERYTNEFQAAPSPDGQVLAMAAGANGRDWWRNGHANWNESHVWLRRERKDKPAKYEELTRPGARELWPMWGGAEGRTLYCVSDRDGRPQNLVAYDLTDGGRPPGHEALREPRPVTHFEGGRVLWPSISGDGKTIVFERDFGVWRVNPTDGSSPERLAITLRGAPAAQATETLNFVGGYRDLAVAPDGRKVAFTVHGEVFAAAAREGGRAVRVTTTPAAEGQLEWAPDSRRLVYASSRGGAQNLYLYDFASQTEAPLTSADAVDSTPKFSPDGKHLAFRRNGTELRLLDLSTKTDRLVVGGLAAMLPPFDDAPGAFAFSPKGQWIAYIDSGKRGYDNVYVVPTTGGKVEPKQVTFFANTGSNAVAWSGDGRSLLFGTGMRTEEFQLARVDLVARQPNFSEDVFRGLFEDEMRTTRPGGPRPVRPQIERTPPTVAPPAVNPPNLAPPPATAPATQPSEPRDLLDLTTRPAAAAQPATQPATLPSGLRGAGTTLPAAETFSFDRLRQRTNLLSVGVDVDEPVVTPDGKWCVFIGGAGGRQNVYAYPLDPSAAGPAGGGGEGGGSAVRQLTTTPGGKSNLRAAADSKEVYYLEAGQIRSLNLDSRQVREVNVTASMEVDFAQEKLEVFRQAWTYLKLNFYDPKMHGADWDAVRRQVEPRAAGAKTGDELRRILSLMVGELNASHLGVGSPARGGGATVGRLGVRFDRDTYEKDGVLKLAEMLTNGPAAQAGLKVGDAVLAVDGDPVDAGTNLEKLLDRKIGRRVVLRVASDAARAQQRDVPVRPVDAATEKTLLYRDWAEANRAHVAKASNGRLGYVHIADMSRNALARLNADLDAESATRDGVVVDVRANTGGFVSPFVLDVLSRRNYLTMTRRGAGESPGRIYVGQRALDLPTVLVTNRQSISDAENFAEGYRALKLGKVVGEPTAGGVIFKSDVPLIDGTVFRIPMSKVTNRAGEDLESAGRPVDVTARRPLGESPVGKDSQLDAAVKTLLKQIDKAAVAKGKPAGKAKPAEAGRP